MVQLKHLDLKRRLMTSGGTLFALLALTGAGAPSQLPDAVMTKPKKVTAPKKPTAPPVKTDVLFEGYSKILMGDKQVGYTIQRFDFNPKTKEYSTVYYLRTQPPANDLIESLTARSTFDLKPIAYSYTEVAGGKVRLVDATFKNGVMTATSLQNGTRTTMPPKKLEPGVFLASFLGYLMLQQKEPVKVGNKYSYKAIAEEDGGIYAGEAFVKSQEQQKGLQTFKILNTYKGAQFVSYMTPKGEVISTDSAAQGISTELVANIDEATRGFGVNNNQLTQLFGAVPKGQDNAVAKHSTGEPLGGAPTKQQTLDGSTPTVKTKTDGVPQGTGIEVKPKGN